MSALQHHLPADRTFIQPDVDQVHGQVLEGILLALTVLAVGILAVYSDNRAAELGIIAVSFSLAGLAAICALVMRRSQLASAGLLTAGVCAIGVVALIVTPVGVILSLLPLIILGATAAAGLSGGIAATLCYGATIAAISRLAPLTSSDSSTALLTGLATLIVGWLVLRPFRTALHWSWFGYVAAIDARTELERHQGELSRALRSLSITQHRLEQVNQELAWAREAAEEARRLKAEFAANISHELRTPLNHIIGFSEVMVTAPETYGGDVLPESYRGDIEAIYRSARHLSQLIDDVLDLSQIEAERMGLVKAWVDLREVVDEALAVVRRFLESKRLALTLDFAPELPAVLVDRTRIRQVLINLLSNAARFTEHGGISVRVRARDHDLVVSVTDTGPGIRAEDLPKVFEEFRQLDGSTRRRHEGSGLGLAISKRFVELHGGNVWAESEVGQGSTFSFSVPVASANLITSPYSGEGPVWDRLVTEWSEAQKTLAVVSPDPALSHLVRRFLEGYSVVDANCLAQVRTLCATGRVDALLVTADSTSAALRALSEEPTLPAGLPIVACSIPNRRNLAREIGVTTYLVKPVDRDALVRAIVGLGPAVRNLLLVDDDPVTLRLFEQMLRTNAYTYRIRKATNGTRALRSMQAKRPDAVILDLLMPDVDGYAVLAAMRRVPELRDVPVIAVSARGAREEAIVADAVAITRRGGLQVGELIRFIRVGLEALAATPTGDATPAAEHPD